MSKKSSRRKRKFITPRQASIAAIIVLALLFTSMLRAGCNRNERANTSSDTNIAVRADSADNHALSNDSESSALEEVIIPKNTPNKPLRYTGFSIGFNPDAHQPNFAVWTLTPDKTNGPYDRKDANFAQDMSVEGCATLNDYRRSGFDRGHMVPAADMKWSAEAMTDCHYLTNISPQDSKLNAGAWAKLEGLERKWANKFGRLIIVAGPILSDRLVRTIGDSGIPVPERFFKVIIAPDANPAMGIGFVMPNSSVAGGTQAAAMSIDQVEAITGFDFFHNLPDDIENEIEAQNSFNQWNIR